ncbi:hypothetical protein Y032_0197g1578 [Ancylostoma ceylanicum]|uniref:Methyltransferase domain-containing protein n=1 Tax=Ancylostoma ceylanicum TaxID=53326 RepID=A0A016SPC6_9BILA|nr:hypothetical protein Y032_0197g1578 [Ancylostoma ceylanicum]
MTSVTTFLTCSALQQLRKTFQVYCSVKVRIGPVNGSGKWMCNPFRIPEGSVVFSYGRHYEIFFELELRKITSNCCFIFGLNDMEQSQKTQLRLSELCAKSRRAKINGTTGEESNKYTTDYLMDLNDLGKVEILRMDIEGDGMDSLPEFLEKHHPAQILTTMHYSPPKMASLLNLFSRQGYWLFSHEIDGMFHDICAFSFIHISGFTRYGAVPLARFLS